uniref:Uncharacterized protein n=1 Tax=Romanomermis culicivorax TaxID=13658 RepID=A0A915HL75_ROMCU
MKKKKSPLVANSVATAQQIYRKSCQLTKVLAFYALVITCNSLIQSLAIVLLMSFWPGYYADVAIYLNILNGKDFFAT